MLSLAALVMIYGFYIAFHARLDVFPNFVPPQVTIQTESPGLAAEQVETLVTRPVETALNALVDSRPRIRCVAAEALGQFGDEARSAVPGLLNTLNDADRLTRKAATNALQAIDSKALTRVGENVR